MLELFTGGLRVTVADAPSHSVGSADNVSRYSYEYVLGGEDRVLVSSRHFVHVSENGERIASCLLLACGGATGVHERSAVVRGRECFVAAGPYVAALALPTLELTWQTQVDDATCFGLYPSPGDDGLLSHGELSVARLSHAGRIVWQAYGADIFTGDFVLEDDRVRIADIEGREYQFDLASGRELHKA